MKSPSNISTINSLSLEEVLFQIGLPLIKSNVLIPDKDISLLDVLLFGRVFLESIPLVPEADKLDKDQIFSAFIEGVKLKGKVGIYDRLSVSKKSILLTSQITPYPMW